jgi:ethanolamine ammonia-lyase small subunit
MKSLTKTTSPWAALRAFTPARVALGRAGGSLPTEALLNFRLAHARARDALFHPFDEAALAAELSKSTGLEVFQLESAAPSFNDYLLRPDLGRQLSSDSIVRLHSLPGNSPDLVIVVSDGLSPLAAERHAAELTRLLIERLRGANWSIAPVCLVRRGRVAIQDHIGELLNAGIALILLGERPGLMSPDSLGAYLVHAPKQGLTDANRNCVSNINERGLSASEAAGRLFWLLTEARTRRISGVQLKDEFDSRKQLKT